MFTTISLTLKSIIVIDTGSAVLPAMVTATFQLCGFQPWDLSCQELVSQLVTQSVSQLVSWCFEPSQPQRITSGLNTNVTPSPSYSFYRSSYHTSCCFQPIYIPWALNMGTCIQQGDVFYFAGLYRNRCQPQPTQEKNWERFWEKCRCMDRKGRNK